jgi:hypothetical protein
MRRTGCALLLLTLAACMDLTALTRAGAPALTFRVGRGGTQTVDGARAVEARPGRIGVQGWIPASGGCQDVDARLRVVGSALTLRVSVRRMPRDAGCPGWGGSIGYRATIRDLDPGTYRLRVVHSVRVGPAWGERRVLERRVRVE